MMTSPETTAQQSEVAKVNLLGLSREKMAAFFVGIGEKPFRAQQLVQWIHQQGVDDFDAMTNISKALRAKLQGVAEIRAPEVLHSEFSVDGTRKWVLKVAGGGAVETVFIPDGDRGTLCVSSQVGCSVDCSFCSTGKQGFQRDLSAAEIIGQVWVANRSFGPAPEDQMAKRFITNVVMMGMGEPLLNFDNSIDAMKLMLDDFAYGISKRRVTLSTSGIVPALDRLADEVDVSLAISLHAPNDALRDVLVPVNRKYPIAELIASCQRWLERCPDTRRRITIEYVLLKGVNDQPEHARELIRVLRDLPCKVNLIPFNPFPGAPYERPSATAIRRFQDLLLAGDLIVTTRTTRGDDIDAACGQLVGNVLDRTRRAERWQNQLIYRENDSADSAQSGGAV